MSRELEDTPQDRLYVSEEKELMHAAGELRLGQGCAPSSSKKTSSVTFVPNSNGSNAIVAWTQRRNEINACDLQAKSSSDMENVGVRFTRRVTCTGTSTLHSDCRAREMAASTASGAAAKNIGGGRGGTSRHNAN